MTKTCKLVAVAQRPIKKCHHHPHTHPLFKRFVLQLHILGQNNFEINPAECYVMSINFSGMFRLFSLSLPYIDLSKRIRCDLKYICFVPRERETAECRNYYSHSFHDLFLPFSYSMAHCQHNFSFSSMIIVFCWRIILTSTRFYHSIELYTGIVVRSVFNKFHNILWAVEIENSSRSHTPFR